MYRALISLVCTLCCLQLNAQVKEGLLLGSWSDTTLLASFVHNNTYNEVWGLVNKDVEYAVIGSTYGTHFIDVSNPMFPNEVVRLPGGTSGRQIIHRDYHDFKNLLYAVSDEGNESTLQIIDYSFLPDSVSLVYDSKSILRTSHNIFIDSARAIMYGCITRGDIAPGSPLRLFDLSDPKNPEIIRSYSKIANYQMSQVHDMYIENDTAYLNCGPSGLVIADFSDPMNAQLITALETDQYPQSGYNHSGWLSEDSNTYFMADETWGMDIKVMDVSNLPNIEIIDTIDAGSDSEFSFPHNQIVHNGLLFSSYYYDGLQVWDIKDVYNIERVMFYPTSEIEARDRYEGAWGVYPFLPSGKILVSDMQNGLFVIDEFEGVPSSNQNVTAKINWSIHPNPSKGGVLIEAVHDQEDIIFEVYDNQGKCVQKMYNTGYHNLDLTPGVYYIRMINNKSYSIKTLVVAR